MSVKQKWMLRFHLFILSLLCIGYIYLESDFFSHELLTNVDTLRLVSVLGTHSRVSKIDIVCVCLRAHVYMNNSVLAYQAM